MWSERGRDFDGMVSACVILSKRRDLRMRLVAPEAQTGRLAVNVPVEKGGDAAVEQMPNRELAKKSISKQEV